MDSTGTKANPRPEVVKCNVVRYGLVRLKCHQFTFLRSSGRPFAWALPFANPPLQIAVS